jgi:hypothetical protein
MVLSEGKKPVGSKPRDPPGHGLERSPEVGTRQADQLISSRVRRAMDAASESGQVFTTRSR